MRVAIRSTSMMEIERMEVGLRRAIEQAIEEEELRSPEKRNSTQRRSPLVSEIIAIGNRPGGELDPNARILQIARAVDAHLGHTAQIQRASTDANIPLSMCRESITIGGGGGRGVAPPTPVGFVT